MWSNTVPVEARSRRSKVQEEAPREEKQRNQKRKEQEDQHEEMEQALDEAPEERIEVIEESFFHEGVESVLSTTPRTRTRKTYG